MYRLFTSVSKCVVSVVLLISIVLLIYTPCTAHMYSNSNNNTTNNDKQKAGSMSDNLNIHANAIIDYSVTIMTQSERDHPVNNYDNNWSVYVPNVCTSGQVVYSSAFLNSMSSIKYFADAEFSSPFYHLQVHWFISPFGFITPMHQAMCPNFCQDRLVETLNGFYNFDNIQSVVESELEQESFTMPHGGGHYPLIGLFVNNLGTLGVKNNKKNSKNDEGKVCVLHGMENDNREYVIVEYHNLYSLTNDYSGSLNAQVQLYSDGEIIMRYQSVPSLTASSSSSSSLQSDKGKLKHDKFTKVMPASTGIVLSSSTRQVLPVPDASNQIIAIRFSPKLDIVCNSLTTKLNCLNTAGCAWCEATPAQCMSTITVTDRCPSSLIRQYIGLFEEEEEEYKLEGKLFEPFYDVVHTQNATFVNLSEVQNSSRYFVNPKWDPVTITVPFSFPFFGEESPIAAASAAYQNKYNNKQGDKEGDSDTTTTTSSSKEPVHPQIRIFNPGTIGVTPNMQQCNRQWNTCPNNNYTYVIAPFQSALSWTSATYLWTGLLHHGWKDTHHLCKDSSACPDGMIIHIENVSMMSYNENYYQYAGDEIKQMGIQIYLDSEGVFAFSYVLYDDSLHETLLWAYPAPLIGLIRNGMDDKYSVIIPPAMLTNGSQIQFLPRNRSLPEFTYLQWSNANEKGNINTDLELSQKEYEELLEEKENGKAKKMKEELHTFANVFHAADAEGVNVEFAISERGTHDVFSTLHDISNTTNTNALQEQQKANQLRLAARRIRNEVQTDPCSQYSFDGCPVCTSHAGCAFCGDNFCFALNLSGTPLGHTCSYYAVRSNEKMCNIHMLPEPSGNFLDNIVLFVLGLCLCALLIILLISCCRIPNNRYSFDLHILGASGGVADYVPVQQERKMVHMAMVTKDQVQKGEYVMAIPLRQVPLKELYNYQQRRKKKKLEEEQEKAKKRRQMVSNARKAKREEKERG